MGGQTENTDMPKNHESLLHPSRGPHQGFTLIELMIVIAIIAILLAIAYPVYANYVIRAKMSEGMSVANAAKTAVAATCIKNVTLPALTNTLAGYSFVEGTHMDDYVSNVQASGACSNPVLTITTKNTGQIPDPIIIMSGEVTVGTGQVTWRCSSNNAPNYLLPPACRS